MTHIPYVYRLTDKTNDKRYIGSRYGKKCEPSDLGVTYFTSSKVVSKLFRDDPERFEKQIIVTGTTEYVIKVEKMMLELYDAVVSEEFYNRTNGKGIHPDDARENGKRVGRRMSESGLIQALGRSGDGGRATKGMAYKIELTTRLHSVKNADGKSALAVKAGTATAAIPGVLASAGRLGGIAAKASGQLLAAAKIGGRVSGAACKELNIGVCGMELADRKTFGAIGGKTTGVLPWWVDPITGATTRALDCPEGFIKGRKVK